MRITVFTSNQPRHVALIERLADIADTVWAIQECNTVFPGQVADFFNNSPVMQDYFSRVMAAEQVQFGGPRFLPSNVRSLAIKMGDLNRLDVDLLAPALQADAFVVFGASWIRPPLVTQLIARQAINIHMGISPYYRGSSCNFWAMYDRRPDLVGATIHRLTKGLDSGQMLFHALPPAGAADPFDLGMMAVRAAQEGLSARLADGSLLALAPVPQDRALEIRYTRNRDFTDEVAAAYLDQLPTAAEIGDRLAGRDPGAFLRPYCLDQ